MQAHKTQEAQAKVEGEEYYNKCLTELKKDADTHLKWELAAY
jgi:hypothetical protein